MYVIFYGRKKNLVIQNLRNEDVKKKCEKKLKGKVEWDKFLEE